MSTHAFVGIKNADGSVTSIYVHNYGYPEGLGQILSQHYNTQELADQLVALGDCSCVCERLSQEDGEQHSFDHPVNDVTVAYHRDRGEDWEDVEPGHYDNVGKFKRECGSISFCYLFEDGEWKCLNADQ